MSIAPVQTSNLASIPTTRLAVARKILRALLPAETGIDNAIAAQSDLIGSIVRGRMEMGAPMDVGHDAAALAAESLARLFEVREQTIKCHQRLAVTRDVLGLDGSDVGCTAGKLTGARRKVRAA
jgi:hypothetical protein